MLKPGERVRNKGRAGELGTVERKARGNTLGDWWVRWDSRPLPVPAYERELEFLIGVRNEQGVEKT